MIPLAQRGEAHSWLLGASRTHPPWVCSLIFQDPRVCSIVPCTKRTRFIYLVIICARRTKMLVVTGMELRLKAGNVRCIGGRFP